MRKIFNKRILVKSALITALGAILLLCAAVLFNFIVDPYHYYRSKTFYKTYYASERTKNAGFIRTMDYDSIITGTSTSENIILSETVSELGFKKPIKLTVSGAMAKEIHTTLNAAFETNPDISKVIWGMDFFSYKGSPDSIRGNGEYFPFYLYDNSSLNDLKYLFSVMTFVDSIKVIYFSISKPKDDPLFNMNNMYQWQHRYADLFTKKNFDEEWKKRPAYNKAEADLYQLSNMKESFDRNTLGLIEENSDVEFIIYLPPYSSRMYTFFGEWGLLDEIEEFRNYIIRTLIKYPNVRLYDFQIAAEITEDFSNYKDMSHFDQKTSSWVLSQIKAGNYLVDEKNADKSSDRFRQLYVH